MILGYVNGIERKLSLIEHEFNQGLMTCARILF